MLTKKGHYTGANVYAALLGLRDEVVAVAASSVPRKRAGFHTQVSVTGQLEKHSTQDSFRVLVNDSTYAYFASGDVADVVVDEVALIGGVARAAIYLRPLGAPPVAPGSN